MCLGHVCTAATYVPSVCLSPYNVTCSLVLAVRPSAAENLRVAAMLCVVRSCCRLPCILSDFHEIRCASCVQPSRTLRRENWLNDTPFPSENEFFCSYFAFILTACGEMWCGGSVYGS